MTTPPIFPTSLSYETSYQPFLPTPTTVSKSLKVTQEQQLRRNTKNEQVKKQQTAYNSALSLAKSMVNQVVQTFFMLWMTGNSIQIFSLIMLAMAAISPIKSIFQIGGLFSKYEKMGANCFFPKFLYFVGNIICIGLVLWKCNKMNLIPLEWLENDKYLHSYQYYNDQSSNGILQSFVSSLFR
jgi:hypothetical protein